MATRSGRCSASMRAVSSYVRSPGQRPDQRSSNASRAPALRSQPATTVTSGTAARAEAWLYGTAVPSTSPEGGPAGSAPIQLSPTMAARITAPSRAR